MASSTTPPDVVITFELAIHQREITQGRAGLPDPGRTFSFADIGRLAVQLIVAEERFDGDGIRAGCRTSSIIYWPVAP